MGSLPFIAFLILRSEVFELSRRCAFALAFLILIDVLILPWAFQSGWQREWIGSLFILIVSAPFWGKINHVKKDKLVIPSQIVEQSPEPLLSLEQAFEDNKNPDMIKSVKEVDDFYKEIDLMPSDDLAEKPTCLCDSETKDFPVKLSLDELIDLGFQEKNLSNYEQAIEYFLTALSLEPIPEIAYYLIVDCYWLWNNLGKRDCARNQLQAYIQKYFSQFNIELRYQFNAWLIKEDLRNIIQE